MPRNLITALANPLRPGPKNQAVAPRFFRFVERVPDGCWMWCGYVMRNGYGTISIEGHGRLAHRVSWELHNGPIPEGMQVCHTCDNRDCVNPDHLFLGTDAENMADKVTKGRQAKGRDINAVNGEAHHSHKLTVEDVREIRRRAAAGAARQELATEYGVSNVAVSKIILRKTWKDIDPDDEAGARVILAKVTEDDVRSIRAAYAAGGVTMQELADRFGIGLTAVSNIVHRRKWKHLD